MTVLISCREHEHHRHNYVLLKSIESDGVAQLVERRTQDPKDRGSNHVRSTHKIVSFFRVKNVVLARCRCAQPPCVHARIRMITYAR